jgi:hypothetical protein
MLIARAADEEWRNAGVANLATGLRLRKIATNIVYLQLETKVQQLQRC